MSANPTKTLLEVKNIRKFFPVKNPLGKTIQQVKAVNNVSFQLFEGETFGLVGESGCGKSTLGRTIMRLIEPTGGEVLYKDQNLLNISEREMRRMRKDLQMVFQDPYSSLNPRKRIGAILEEALIIHGMGDHSERTDKVMEMLHTVGMQPDSYYRYPHEFSGGQRQRIGIARALILNPKLLICDEPVSALDVSIQSQIINLMKQLQSEFHLTILFIAHDISVVRHISDRIGVMYLGQMVEQAPTDRLFEEPLHPYTKALLSAVPLPNPKLKRERIILKGDLPSPMNPPLGCSFHTRCPFTMEICKKEPPQVQEISQDHWVACHLY
ncbi:ABC transporter ATP-binding protein [Ammoniphilus sp. YIM 78166]|uniref:ABC transporter ATP-binding protein n=1 Tax=Ammoniphilus sp. YIM 78166 TaxID=1644106 RepID=UPI0010700E86|nr:dipeptide ABC transporter ATP-binding protein [Ammoniphilus sp. YIM 78166]